MTYRLGLMNKMIPKIICDKCNIPVQRGGCNYYGSNDEYVIIVYCHGQWERQRFPARFLDDGWEIMEARAFRQKKRVIHGDGFIMRGPPDTVSTIIEGEVIHVQGGGPLPKCITAQTLLRHEDEPVPVKKIQPQWMKYAEGMDVV